MYLNSIAVHCFVSMRKSELSFFPVHIKIRRKHLKIIDKFSNTCTCSCCSLKFKKMNQAMNWIYGKVSNDFVNEEANN